MELPYFKAVVLESRQLHRMTCTWRLYGEKLGRYMESQWKLTLKTLSNAVLAIRKKNK